MSRTLALVCIAISIAAAHRFGVPGQYAFFPAMAACFFLVRAGEALGLCLIGFLLQAWIAYGLGGWDARTLAFLSSGLLVCLCIHAFARRLRTDINRLYEDSTLDPLTGAGNRRLLDDAIAQAPAGSSLLMIDVDHFKTVNDRYGHAAGDLCLQRLAERLRQRLESDQRLFRYGGEEFVVLLPGDHAAGTALAESLRADVARQALIRETGVTISIGVAEHRSRETARDWIRRADDALYQAKSAGRDQVRAAG